MFVSFVFMPVNVCQCLKSLGSFAVRAQADHNTKRLFHRPQAALSPGPSLHVLITLASKDLGRGSKKEGKMEKKSDNGQKNYIVSFSSTLPPTVVFPLFYFSSSSGVSSTSFLVLLF